MPMHSNRQVFPKGVERLLIQTDNSFGLWDEADFQPDFVYLTADAAEWLVQKGVQLVGIDYLSVEQFRDQSHEHTALC